MQPAHHGLGNGPAELLDRAADRRALPEREVSSSLVAVSGIRGHDPAEVCLSAQHGTAALVPHVEPVIESVDISDERRRRHCRFSAKRPAR